MEIIDFKEFLVNIERSSSASFSLIEQRNISAKTAYSETAISKEKISSTLFVIFYEIILESKLENLKFFELFTSSKKTTNILEQKIELEFVQTSSQKNSSINNCSTHDTSSRVSRLWIKNTLLKKLFNDRECEYNNVFDLLRTSFSEQTSSFALSEIRVQTNS
jgi:hypothetical protein